MDDNIEIDYAAVIGNMKKQLNDLFAMQNKYFSLARRIKELKPYSEIISERMMELPMDEQVVLMELVVRLSDLQKALCERHGWDDGVEPVNYD